ncbi:MAG: hypothetical protein ACRCSQ_09390 [Bacteroidales bacterium]
MRSKDWKPELPAKMLVIGEDPNLQWSEQLPQYVMFTDYYFRKKPTDLGERSRYTEAKNLFDMIKELTSYKYFVDEIYVTCLCNDTLPRPAKGKRTLIPEKFALKGVEHIKWILEQHPEIEVIIALSQQTNYWLQKSGLVESCDAFIAGAEPRRTGMQDLMPYYQPVNPKSFNEICAKPLKVIGSEIKVYPLLPLRDYPLRDRNKELFGDLYDQMRKSFSEPI